MAVTFTNKATSEMKHRILTVLEQLALGKWEEAKSYLKELQNIYPAYSKEQIKEKAAFIYRQILHDYGRLTITTIDKFVQQIIRSFTFELGIDADYHVSLNLKQVAEDLNELLYQALNENPDLQKWIVELAIKNIKEGKNWNYEKELKQLSMNIFSEDFQLFDESIKNKDSRQLFSDTVNQIKDAKESFEDTLRDCFETAQQIFQRTNPETNALRGKSRSPLLHLDKSFQQFLDYLLKNGSNSLNKLIDNRDAWFAKDETDNFNQLYTDLNPALSMLVAFFDSEIVHYYLALAIESNLYYLRLMLEMSRLLKDYRVENHVLLISDATLLLAGITKDMEDNPSFIWEKAGNRYKHFLFDEFQDTSKMQWENFLPLVKNALGEASGRSIEHLIVGDIKQSIYRWRGGDWNILLKEASHSLGESFVDTASLKANYRSDAQIVTFNNYIFPFVARWLQNCINGEVQGQTDNSFIDEQWHTGGFDTVILKAYEDVVQEVPNTKDRQAGIVDWKIFEVENNKSRFKQIKEAILKEVADRLYRWIIEEKRYQPGQIGILIRKNAEAQALITYIKQDLQDRGNPDAYAITSGDALQLNDNPAVQLLLQTFHLLCQTDENKILFQSRCIYLFQLFRTDKKHILTGDDWLQMGNGQQQDTSQMLPEEILKGDVRLLQLPLEELFEELIQIYHLSESTASLPYLLAFRDIIATFVLTENTGLSSFLDWWQLQGDLALPEETTSLNAVQIMTIHKAKGLAFDVVVLPFLTFPFSGKSNEPVWADVSNSDFSALNKIALPFNKSFANSSLKGQYYKEQLYSFMDALNTLYVAMTRPRKHLFLCLPGFAETSKAKPSMIGDVLVAALEEYRQLYKKEFIDEEPDIRQTDSPGSKEQKGDWSLSHYPTAGHLKSQLDEITSNQLMRISNDENIKIGMAVHELLALCENAGEIKTTLHQLIQEGWCTEKDKPIIQKTAEKVFQNNALKALLSKPCNVLNERDVLDAEGFVHRPDKVLLGEKETIIIDFKFTGHESNSHREQVKLYIKLFSEMHYPQVRGYLFYGFQNKLEEVS